MPAGLSMRLRSMPRIPAATPASTRRSRASSWKSIVTDRSCSRWRDGHRPSAPHDVANGRRIARNPDAGATMPVTNRPTGRSVPTRRRRWPSPIPPSRAGAAASGSWTPRSTRSRRAATARRRSTTSPGAAETSKGGVYFHFPTKEAIFRELMPTTADKLVGQGGARGRAGDRAGRPGGGGHPHRARDVRRPPDDGPAAVPGHDRAPGASSRRRRTRSTSGSRG